MGIAVISSLSRRLQFRGGRPVARAGRRVLPRHAVAHLRHRPAGHRAARCSTSTRRPGTRTSIDAADRRLLQAAPARRRDARLRARLIHTAADGGGDRQLCHLSALRRGGAQAAAGRAARPARLPPRRPRADLGRRGREHHRDPQALRHARHVAGRAVARGARDAVDRDEPHRRALRQRRGRRGPGALQAARRTATTPTRRSSRSPRAGSA